MNKLILLLFATVLIQGAVAQQVEQLQCSEELLLMKMTDAQRLARFEKQQKAGHRDLSYRGIELLPDSLLYAGEPIDVYYSASYDYTGTVTAELYNLSGKRPKRLLSKEFTPNNENRAGGNITLRILIDTPARYELVLYCTDVPMELSPERAERNKARRILDILPKPAKP